MALSEQDRQRVHNGIMRYWSQEREAVTGITKTDLRAAINANDDWIDNNQAAFNAALPEPFRTQATLAQKTLLFCAVAAMRVSPAFARKLFGEVD